MGTHGYHARRHGRFARGAGGHSRDGEMGGPIRPVYGDRHDSYGDKPDYKTAALCKQVRRIVSLALSGECGDPVLQSLVVHDVLPAPNAGRLLVQVVYRMPVADPSMAEKPLGVIDVLERLSKVEGLLRARIGESIVRKRTPELSFDALLLPAGGLRATEISEVSDD